MHFELGLLSESEFSRLKDIANTLQKSIPGPNIILFMRSTQAVLSTRVTLSSHPEVIVTALGRQISLYSEWLASKAAEILVIDNSKCKLASVQRLFSEGLS
jgi:hypothetical protein